jgi:hypothetical protein
VITSTRDPAPAKLAIVALIVAVCPWIAVGLLSMIADSASDAAPDVIVLVIIALAGPIAAILLGGVVAHRLHEAPLENRPPGAGIAKAARNLGALTIVAYIAWFLSWPWRHLEPPIHDEGTPPSSTDAGTL